MPPIRRKTKPLFRVENGRIYFTRAAERRFFFVLTVVMLLWGIAVKAGWLI